MTVQLGSVVRFRHRQWVVLPSDDPDVLLLRPLTATTDDAVPVHRLLAQLLGYSLPSERIAPDRFPFPDPTALSDAEAVRLLWHAARLQLREGAAPFRSLGRISVRPRPYQFVPLLMALRLDPVRLLIADDVGVGKTIEAGLIARELLESGDARRLAVLCPPALCDQWETELREKFHLDPVVVSPATLARLERTLPPDQSLYRYYPVVVASIDFLKLPRNREAFLDAAPDLVIVDEAHGVVPATNAKRDPTHLRYQLVAELARHPHRHLILLTATPHSGIPHAFQRLLGLLNPTFEQWELDKLDQSQREQLTCHLVQRTRADIQRQWPEATGYYPERQAIESTYALSSRYRELYRKTFDLCRALVERSRHLPDRQRRFQWWAALTLLRCIMSSPHAGAEALARRQPEREEPLPLDALLDDDTADDHNPFALEPVDRLPLDEVPTTRLSFATRHAQLLPDADRRFRELERLARSITPDDDTKLQGCLALVRDLLQRGANPVIWCIFVDTAEYLAAQLKQALTPHFPDLAVACLTGRLGDEERRAQIAALLAEPRRVLVATDCLSEGVNLQEGFDAVIHYDLPWNPNRLEQREGRVDRFGQPKPVVYAVRYYGRDNPVDAEVIDVLIHKANQIRQSLGVHVPVPEDEGWLAELLVHRLFERPRQAQLALPLDAGPDPAEQLYRRWDDDAQRERVRRTRFAQYAIDAVTVAREVEACDDVLGDETTVRDFTLAAAQRLGLHIVPAATVPDCWLVHLNPDALATVPDPVRLVLPRPPDGRWRITFTSPPPAGSEWIGRNHPLVAALARQLFELAFTGQQPDIVARIGVVRTSLVPTLTALVSLRVRYTLTRPERSPALLEEVLPTGYDLATDRWLDPPQARQLASVARPEANIPLAERRELASVVAQTLRPAFEQPEPHGPLADLLTRRATELADAHRRVRQAARARLRGLTVEPLWPPDPVAVLVLQPAVSSRR